VVDGLGAAANPAAVAVVDVGTVGDERSCAGIDPVFVDDGRCAGITPDRFIAPEFVDDGRVIGALAEGGYGAGAPLDGAALDGAIGARTVVEVASGPPIVVGSAFRAGLGREPPRAVGISSGTRTLVAVASPMGPL
jgi:hypothetical protein